MFDAEVAAWKESHEELMSREPCPEGDYCLHRGVWVLSPSPLLCVLQGVLPEVLPRELHVATRRLAVSAVRRYRKGGNCPMPHVSAVDAKFFCIFSEHHLPPVTGGTSLNSIGKREYEHRPNIEHRTFHRHI